MASGGTRKQNGIAVQQQDLANFIKIVAVPQQRMG
jgi:hypothetical protein